MSEEKSEEGGTVCLNDLLSDWPDQLIIDLRHYLIAHEIDIAHGINDFGRLRGLYKAIFHESPQYR